MMCSPVPFLVSRLTELSVLLALVFMVACAQPIEEDQSKMMIDIWYGEEQHFGHLGGHPQRWVNLLGNVSPAQDIVDLRFSLNGEAGEALNVTADKFRLAKPGDFNLEILRERLRDGENTVVITASDRKGRSVHKTVSVVYHGDGEGWPLPYEIDWSRISELSDAVQIVDGKWALTPQGIRSIEHHYDRVVAFGDDSWKDYEVSTTVTFHDFTPPETGQNGTNVTHAAIAVRWPGHDPDGNQPTIKWYPLGATAEFRIGYDLQQCRWRIFDGQRAYYVESERRRSIELEKAYHMKHRVRTLQDGRSLFQVKLWSTDEREPAHWDLERFEPEDDVPRGSALLLAHFTDVTFGDVKVIPLDHD
jgi:hypothetical protein